MAKRITLPLTFVMPALLLTGCAADVEGPQDAWVYENKLAPVSESGLRFTVAGGSDENPTGLDFENLQQMTRPGARDPWDLYDQYSIETTTQEAMEIYLDLRTDPRIYESDEPLATFDELLTKDYRDTRSGEFFGEFARDWNLGSVRRSDISQIPLPHFEEQYGRFSTVDTSRPQEIEFTNPVITGYVTERSGLTTLHAEFRETVRFQVGQSDVREYSSMVGVTFAGDPFTEHLTDSETAIYNIIYLEDEEPGQEDYERSEESRSYSAMLS